jgi:hypothetical protein
MEEAMRQKIALPLALGVALAASLPASAPAALAGPVNHYRAIHHRSVAMRAEAPAPPATFAQARSRAFGDHKTDGLSRNPDDCVTYGCVDNGGD